MATGYTKYCFVEGCRFYWSHTTKAHKCGSCNEFGHGVYECGNHNSIMNLQNLENKSIPRSDWCDLEGCRYPHSHTKDAHHCSKCFKNHSAINCPIQSLEHHIERFGNFGSTNLNNFDYHNFLENKNNVVITEYAGMGCSLIIRKKNNCIDSLFMDSYFNDMTIHDTFIYGMTDITSEYNNTIRIYNGDNDNNSNNGNNYNDNDYNDNDIPDLIDDVNIIKCPLCRTLINKNNIKTIKALEDKCKICFEADVSIYFEECQHACVCIDCLEKL